MSQEDFTQANPKREKAVTWIDHETGMIHVPGKGPMPLVGPTTGREYERLKLSEEEKIEFNQRWYGIASKDWKCTQCGKVCRRLKFAMGRPLPGQVTPIIRWRRLDATGPETEVLACPHKNRDGEICDGTLIPKTVADRHSRKDHQQLAEAKNYLPAAKT